MGFDRENVGAVMAPGIILMIPECNRQIQVPQITVGQYEDNEETIYSLSEIEPLPSGTPREQIRAREKELRAKMMEIVCVALTRNYPKVEVSDLRNLTMTDLKRAFAYALNGPGEDVAAPATTVNGKAAPSATATA